jgi:hypothetical protein
LRIGSTVAGNPNRQLERVALAPHPFHLGHQLAGVAHLQPLGVQPHVGPLPAQVTLFQKSQL